MSAPVIPKDELEQMRRWIAVLADELVNMIGLDAAEMVFARARREAEGIDGWLAVVYGSVGYATPDWRVLHETGWVGLTLKGPRPTN